MPTLVVHAFAILTSCACSAGTLLQRVLQGCSTHKSELCLAVQGLLCLTGYHAACCNLLSGCCAILVGMATALQPVTLKRGNEQLLKFRAGTKIDTILHQLAAVCPGGRIEDSEGFVVTLGYVEDLTEKEYAVIDPTPAGATIIVPADCIFTLCPKEVWEMLALQIRPLSCLSAFSEQSQCSLEAFAANFQQACHQLMAACRWQLLCMSYTSSLHSIVAEVYRHAALCLYMLPTSGIIRAKVAV